MRILSYTLLIILLSTAFVSCQTNRANSTYHDPRFIRGTELDAMAKDARYTALLRTLTGQQVVFDCIVERVYAIPLVRIKDSDIFSAYLKDLTLDDVNALKKDDILRVVGTIESEAYTAFQVQVHEFKKLNIGDLSNSS